MKTLDRANITKLRRIAKDLNVPHTASFKAGMEKSVALIIVRRCEDMMDDEKVRPALRKYRELVIDMAMEGTSEAVE